MSKYDLERASKKVSAVYTYDDSVTIQLDVNVEMAYSIIECLKFDLEEIVEKKETITSEDISKIDDITYRIGTLLDSIDRVEKNLERIKKEVEEDDTMAD